MSFQIVLTHSFIRQVERFKKSHPELKQKLAKTLRDLANDPFQSHLKLHALKGSMKEFHAVSINYQYRMTLILHITEKEIILIDIGTHDEVYR